MSSEASSVYKLISKVQGILAKEGISKDQSNSAQHYKFRGIDDIYNSLAKHIAEAGLCILPRVLSSNCVERTTKNGSTLFYTTVDVEFDFVSSHDASKHTVRTLGEAMDSGDKSTNKAMSAAYKYACLQTFCIPTEGESKDSEEQTYENVHKKSIFQNSATRNTYCNNVINSYKECTDMAEVKTIADLNKEKVEAMKASGNEYDALAVDEIRKQYILAKQRIESVKSVESELTERSAAFSESVRGVA